MRLLAPLLAALLVPLAGCFHAVEAAGVPSDKLSAAGYKQADSKSETRLGVAKIEVRQYERQSLASGYATLLVVTVTDVPVLTSRAVEAAATDALARADARDDGTMKVAFEGAGAGEVDAKRFVVKQDGQEGKGFRAEFACSDGYVLVIGLGADLPIPGATGSTMFDNVVKLAKDVTCSGG